MSSESKKPSEKKPEEKKPKGPTPRQQLAALQREMTKSHTEVCDLRIALISLRTWLEATGVRLPSEQLALIDQALAHREEADAIRDQRG